VKQTADPSKPETNVQYVGAGLADLDAAVGAKVALSRPSISFGAVPGGGGQTMTQTVAVTNLTSGALTLPVTVQDSTGPGAFSVSPSSLTLSAGQSKVVTVTLAMPKGAAPGHTQAFLLLGAGGNVAHAPLYAFVK
jgi:hypothetical protein